jgi:hypothetical protein
MPMTDVTHEGPSAALGLGPTDLPAMCIAADAQADWAQRRYLLLMRAQIVIPLVGVAIGAAANLDESLAVLGVVAAVAAALLAALRAIQRSSEVERVWYESRATAEEVKSLAWRYAVRGSPFDRPDQGEEEADELLIDELGKIARDRRLLEPPDPFGEITPAMRALRNTERLSDRRDAYLNGRVDDQRAWYARRARHDAAIADRWDMVFFVLTGLAVVAGVLLAANPDLSDGLGPTVGLTAGSSGAVIAWVGVRRYSSLSRAYSVVATELSMLEAVARHKDTPEEWVAFVEAAEQAVGREHMQWRAARQ